MKKILQPPVLVTVLVMTFVTTFVTTFALPQAAFGHGARFSDDTEFGIGDGRLVLSHQDRHGSDEVVITEEGTLAINGRDIDVARGERRKLRKLYRESRELERMADEIAAEAERIASASTGYAAAQVARVLKSLGDDERDGKARDEKARDEKEFAEIEARFEEQMRGIEKFSAGIEQQADKVLELAEDLQERIPELGELDWFLDD